MRLRPILGVKNGKLKPRGVLYGKSNMVEKFTTYINKKINRNKRYRVMVAHANAKSKAGVLIENLLRINDNIDEHFVLELGCALGAHAGPGALAVGLQEVDI